MRSCSTVLGPSRGPMSRYLRLLRGQLERYIAEERGADCLARGKNQTEPRKIKQEIADLEHRLGELEARKAALERAMKK